MISVAVSDSASIALAAEHGGMIATQPDPGLVRAFDEAAGGGRRASEESLHAAAIRERADAGFTHVAIAQVGPDQEAFLRMWRDHLSGPLA
jgi:hypothetical protein